MLHPRWVGALMMLGMAGTGCMVETGDASEVDVPAEFLPPEGKGDGFDASGVMVEDMGAVDQRSGETKTGSINHFTFHRYILTAAPGQTVSLQANGISAGMFIGLVAPDGSLAGTAESTEALTPAVLTVPLLQTGDYRVYVRVGDTPEITNYTFAALCVSGC